MDIIIALFKSLPFNSAAIFAGWIFLLYGIFLLLTASIGMLRMPDLYSKMQAASVADSLGTPLILGFVAINYGMTSEAVKVLLLIVLLLIVNPVITYSLAQASLYDGILPKGTRK